MRWVARARDELTDTERREVRQFVLRLWRESGYAEWEDFVRAAGIKQTTAHAWRWRSTSPPVPSGPLLYRMLKAAGVLDEKLFIPLTEAEEVADAAAAAREAAEAGDALSDQELRTPTKRQRAAGE